MLTKLRKEQLKTILDNYKCSDARIIQNIITEILDFLPVQSEHFQPTIRHCEFCRHQGDCPHKEECSRAYRQKDYYQKR